MPNPTFRVSVISRGGGRSAVATAAYDSGSKLSSVVASAAYRSGEVLHDQQAGRTFDYTNKEDVLLTQIMKPDQAPAWMGERERLWNAVEAGEKRKDAQLARSIIAALPRELPMEDNIAMVQQFVQQEFVARGMVADVAVHDKDASDGGRNPHVHIMLTMRDLDGNGFGKKNRDWNNKAVLQGWRDRWEDTTNAWLEAAGSEGRLSMASYADQGIDKVPTEHLGYEKAALERQGVETAAGDRNRHAEQRNAVTDARGAWQEPVAVAYSEADIEAYYEKLSSDLVVLDEPDYEALPEERMVRGQRVWMTREETRWFGLGARQVTHRFENYTYMEREHSPDDAVGDQHGRSLSVVVMERSRAHAHAALEQWQRVGQVMKDTAEKFGQSVLDRYSRWTEQLDANIRESGHER